MKIPTTLLNRVLLNEGLQVGCTIVRDAQEIERRYQKEGMGFLTMTLPTLDDALLLGLSQGRLTPLMFNGFKPFKRGGSLPGLLSGFFRRIFDIDGSLLEHPCIDSIRAVRQVARLFKKVELPCTEARQKQAYERYVSNDENVIDVGDWNTIDVSLWTRVNSYLWSDLEILSGELYCFPGKFGSGTTAERSSLHERLSVCVWPRRAEDHFPAAFHALAYPDAERLSSIDFLEEADEWPVRVVQVPKTLKTPRTISVEPSYMMLMQQSIAQPLMRYLEGSHFPYKSIRFTNQLVNRNLARDGSIDGSLATIDLSDASDLVSNSLVRSMFEKVAPSFLDLIQACRSASAQLPDSRVIQLRKFASMGSALCFPVEAMTFFAIACYSILRQTGSVPSRKRLAEITADLAIYGDDIIVPVEMVSGLMEDLEAFGLRVNMNKSFHTGFFRESCGGDYYRGHDVTPTYVRHWSFTGDTCDTSTIIGLVSLSNQFYLKGIWHAAEYIRSYLQSVKGNFPISRREIGCLHFASVVFSDSLRYDNSIHRFTVRGLVPFAKRREDRIHELHGALFHTFQLRDHSAANERINLRFFSAREGIGNGARGSVGLHGNHEYPTRYLGAGLGGHGLLQGCSNRVPSSGEVRIDEESGLGGRLYSEFLSIPDGLHLLFKSLDPKGSRIKYQESLDFLYPVKGTDSSTSVVPYATKLKRKWMLSQDSIVF